ncbi:hypothetical protein AB1Y20_022223 [Prymnesium parvum]|uniref:Calponin-homology (CH) domain-containing protein n=1 Tax=Prymnesium parvum TaxID=97485 RepID=A0AB34JIW9_PRYPA
MPPPSRRSAQLGQLRGENEQLAHGMHEASAESSRLLEALRRREASEAAARAEAGRMRALLQARRASRHESRPMAHARTTKRMRGCSMSASSCAPQTQGCRPAPPPPLPKAQPPSPHPPPTSTPPPLHTHPTPPHTPPPLHATRLAQSSDAPPVAQELLSRLRSKMGEHASLVHLVADAKAGMLPPAEPKCLADASAAAEEAGEAPPHEARGAWGGEGTPRDVEARAASGGGVSAGGASARQTAPRTGGAVASGHRATRPSSGRPAVWQRSHTPPTAAPPCARTPYCHSKGRKPADGAQTRRQVAPQPKAGEAPPPPPPPPPPPLLSPAAGEGRASLRACSPGGVAGGAPPAAGVERRDAALVMQLGSLREWLQESLGLELPPGDLPSLLQDGQILCRLAAALPGFAPPPADAPPIERIHAFSAACRQLGVPSDSLLQPHHLLPGPHKSASALVNALSALAREAYVRGFLPALPPV